MDTDGTAELMQLAHLLRVGAQAARDVAAIRPRDESAIEQLAVQAEGMAAKLEGIARCAGESAGRHPLSSLLS